MKNPPESSREQNTGKRLAWFAIALWALSLAFPVFFSGEEILWVGFSVLLIGWEPMLFALCFAWLANLFFLYAFFKVVNGKPVYWSILIALLLSSDSLRFHSMLMVTSIDGYGWGFLLWFLAIFVLVIANGFIVSDREEGYYDNYRRWMKRMAICLATVAVTIVPFYLVHDYWRGNAEEKAILLEGMKKGLVFKPRPVCTEPVPSLSSPLITGKGPVAVRFAHPVKNNEGFDEGFYVPFKDVERLLSWGIPSVRTGKRDSFYQQVGTEFILTSRPATGNVIANILVDHTKQTIVLQDSSGNDLARQVFRTLKDGRSCPSYHFYPDPDENPQKWITQALGVNAVKYEASEESPVTMEVVRNETVDSSSLPAPVIALPEGKRQFNLNCPANVGIFESERIDKKRQYHPLPNAHNFFRVDMAEFELRLGLHNPYFIGASCTPDHVYLMAWWVGGRVEMEKRALPSFALLWRTKYSSQDLAKLLDLRAMAFEEQQDGTLATFQFHDEAKPPATVRIIQLKIHGEKKD